ncbi:MAG: putative signal transducing protein [Candidatus Bipolaricaulota bacterium]
MSPEMELVEVFVTWNEQKAELIKALLGDYGINCYLSSHITHSVYPIPVDGLGEIRVMVPEKDRERSTNLIENYFSKEDPAQDD